MRLSSSKKDPSLAMSQPYTLCVLFKGETLNIQIRKRQDDKFALGSAKPDENVSWVDGSVYI